MLEYKLKVCHWETHRDALSLIRRKVFIEEQSVPEDLEWDEFDENSQHILALNVHDEPIATGRIKSDGHIGRMAVLKNFRKNGIGGAILLALIELAEKNQLQSVYCFAQTSAIGFYLKYGFNVVGEEFMDAGIPHQRMFKNLK